MEIALPAVILFGIGVALLIRSRTIRPFEAVVVGLFGFFLAATGLGQAIGVLLDGAFGSHHTAPIAPGPPTATAPSGVVPPSPLAPGQPGSPFVRGV